MQTEESTPMERQVSTTMPRQVSTTSSAGGAGKRRPSVTGDAGKRRPSVSAVPEDKWPSKVTERRPSTPSTAASSRRPSVSKNGAKEDHPEQKEKHKPFVTEDEKKAVKQALEKLQKQEGTEMSRQTSGGSGAGGGGRASSKERPGQRQSSKSRLPADRRRSMAKQKKECKQQNAVVVK